tara:strand:- start:7025 stop:8152 length:1128 start_codon:yes stop_codon:yes gene_type:complete
MNTRKMSVLIGTLCLGAAAGIAFFSQGVQAVEIPPGDYSSDTDATPTPVTATDDQIVPVAAPGSWQKSSGTGIGAATADRKQEDTGGWTEGIIRGDVKLAVSVLDKIGSITVVVEELRGSFRTSEQKAPKRLYAQVDRGEGTPTFKVTGVPFSEYPYRVTLHASGLNGSQQTLSVTKEEPLHDIVLAITPGAPFSILLRDQDSGFHTDVDLLMRPVGLPNGRPRLTGKSDNFGSVIFDSVLAGSYELIPTLENKPFGDPQIVTVQPGAHNYGRKIRGQGHTMVIPRGVRVDVRVHDRNGYGMEGATVTAVATDRRTSNPVEGQTDSIGRLRFNNLRPGTWQFTVQYKGFQRVDQQITLRKNQEPLEKDIRIVRLR